MDSSRRQSVLDAHRHRGRLRGPVRSALRMRGAIGYSVILFSLALAVVARGQERVPYPHEHAAIQQEVVPYPEECYSYPPGIVGDPHGRVRNPHPLVPPLRCCDDKYRCGTGSAAYCVPVPYCPIPNTDIPTDPSTATQQLITINQAVRVALANSEVVRNLGLVDANSQIDIIRGRATVYDAPAALAQADSEWGIFDPRWTTEMLWDKSDIPPGTSFAGIGSRPPQLDTADFISSIEQLLPLGTRVRADYVTDYLFNPDHPPNLDPNPQYFSYQQFGIVQPLMQGLGVNVTMAPIRIAAAEAERTDWRFKQEVLALVRSVETAYWSLYAEQQNLRAIDESLPLFREIVRVREEQARGPAGTETEVARATSELLLYEQRRLDTLSKIAEQQLAVRDLLGLPPNDGYFLALVAAPTTSLPVETIEEAVTTAVNRRPSVLRQRVAVYVARQERIVAQDRFRPKLDFGAFWRINGLGEDLGESLEVVGENDFNDWHLGVSLEVPLGRRDARAKIRSAEYIIQKQRALLDQVVHQTSFEIADAYRRINWLHQMYKVSSSRVEALGKWREGARTQFENPPPGMSTVVALELYLDNLRDYVDASINSNAILADLNSAYARLEEVKGTLLEQHLIEVSGDATEGVLEELPVPGLKLPESVLPGQSDFKSSGNDAAIAPVAQSPIAVPNELPAPGLRLPASVLPGQSDFKSSGNDAAIAPVTPSPIDAPNELPPIDVANDLPAPGLSLPESVLPRQYDFKSSGNDAAMVPVTPSPIAVPNELPAPGLRLPASVLPGQSDFKSSGNDAAIAPVTQSPIDAPNELPPIAVPNELPAPGLRLPASVLPGQSDFKSSGNDVAIAPVTPSPIAVPNELPAPGLRLPASVLPGQSDFKSSGNDVAIAPVTPSPIAVPNELPPIDVANELPSIDVANELPAPGLRLPASVLPGQSDFKSSGNDVAIAPVTPSPIAVPNELPAPGLRLPASVLPGQSDFKSSGNDVAMAPVAPSPIAVPNELPAPGLRLPASVLPGQSDFKSSRNDAAKVPVTRSPIAVPNELPAPGLRLPESVLPAQYDFRSSRNDAAKVPVTRSPLAVPNELPAPGLRLPASVLPGQSDFKSSGNDVAMVPVTRSP